MTEKKIDPIIANGMAIVAHDFGAMILFNRTTFVQIALDQTKGEFRHEPEISAAVVVTPQMIEQMHALLGQWLEKHREPPPEAKPN